MARTLSSILCAALALALPLTAFAQSRHREFRPASQPRPEQNAQQAYERGLHLYDQDHFEEALAVFQASNAAFPSPNSRLYIARCLRELHRLIEAIHEYEGTLRVAQERAQIEARYAPTRLAAADEVVAVRARIGGVRIEVRDAPGESTLQIAGAPIDRTRWNDRIDVLPGPVGVSLAATGFTTAQRDVNVSAGAERRIRLGRLTPRGLTAVGGAGIASFVLTGVGVAGTIGFLAAATARFNDISQRCGMMPCPANERGAIDEGRTFETLGYVSLGIAAATAVLGTVLIVAETRPRSATRQLEIEVLAGGLGARGTF